MNIVSVVLLSLLTLFSLAQLLALRLFGQKIANYEQAFAGFVNPKGEGKTSPLADLVDTAGKAMGRAVALEVKTTLMGKASGVARQMDAVQGDMVLDSTPALATAFPSLGKRLGKNPALAGIAQLVLQRFMGAAGGQGNTVSVAGNGHASTPRFQL